MEQTNKTDWGRITSRLELLITATITWEYYKIRDSCMHYSIIAPSYGIGGKE